MDCYADARVKQVLQESVESGLFTRFFMEAQIYASNKVKDLKHFSCLFESFYTGRLDRWVYYPVAPSKPELALKKEKISSIEI